MKRIVVPTPVAVEAGKPKLTCGSVVHQVLMYSPVWLSSPENSRALGDLLDVVDRAPSGPWDVEDKTREVLQAVMQGMQERVSPIVMRFFVRFLTAVYGAEEAPAEKASEKSNGAAAESAPAQA
jgi:hypothetical protein